MLSLFTIQMLIMMRLNKFLTQKQVRTIYNKISDSRSEETTTYQYEKNAEGYPTKITEKFNDTEARVVVKYQY